MQSPRRARPAWLAKLLVALGLSAGAHALEFAPLKPGGAPPLERFDGDEMVARYFALSDEFHAMVRDSRRQPAVARAFYSTAERGTAR